MSETRVKILDLDFQLGDWNRDLYLGKSYEEAFSAPEIDGLIDSLAALRSAIRWSWLQWQHRTELRPIQEAMRFVAIRAADALMAKGLPKDSFRGLHDRMLLCCAILSADTNVMRIAAERTMEASNRGNAKAHELALAGILKARLQSNAAAERRQLQILEDSRSLKSDPLPSSKLLRAFVARAYDTVAKEIEVGAKRHWSDAYMGPCVIQESTAEITIKIGKKDCYFIWPYVEAVFAKLAIMDGATITYNDFWFPLDFVMAGIDEWSAGRPARQPPHRKQNRGGASNARGAKPRRQNRERGRRHGL